MGIARGVITSHPVPIVRGRGRPGRRRMGWLVITPGRGRLAGAAPRRRPRRRRPLRRVHLAVVVGQRLRVTGVIRPERDDHLIRVRVRARVRGRVRGRVAARVRARVRVGVRARARGMVSVRVRVRARARGMVSVRVRVRARARGMVSVRVRTEISHASDLTLSKLYTPIAQRAAPPGAAAGKPCTSPSACGARYLPASGITRSCSATSAWKDSNAQ